MSLVEGLDRCVALLQAFGEAGQALGKDPLNLKLAVEAERAAIAYREALEDATSTAH